MLTVATIIRESLQATLCFAAWYRDQGADRVIIHFDDPDDPAIDLLSDLPWVTSIPCTDDFWARLGMKRTRRFTRRQNVAITAAYRSVREGWFLNVDGDELLHLQGRTTAQELARQPDTVRGVQFLPAEHVQTPAAPDKMHFRLPMGPNKRHEIYGSHARAMKPRAGLIGHVEGKSATRAGLKRVHIRQHWAETADGKPIRDLTLGPDQNAYLLHFVDQGYDVWRNKLDWRLGARGFRGQLREQLIAAFDAPNREQKLREIYEMIHVFDGNRLDKLKTQDACVTVPFSQKATIQAGLPHLVDAAFPKERAG